MMTASQLRAARALLDVSQSDIAGAIGVSPNTISNIEKGTSNPAHDTLVRLQGYFETQGIELTENEGVRKKAGAVAVYRGHEGFIQFRKDVLSAAKLNPKNLNMCVSNVDERNFSRWGSDELNKTYRKEMAQLQGIQCRIIVKEGDLNLTGASYAEYRWASAKDFGDIPFYIYADKLCIMPFQENDIQIITISHPLVTEFYREQFEKNWKKAIPVDGGKK